MALTTKDVLRLIELLQQNEWLREELRRILFPPNFDTWMKGVDERLMRIESAIGELRGSAKEEDNASAEPKKISSHLRVALLHDRKSFGSLGSSLSKRYEKLSIGGLLSEQPKKEKIVVREIGASGDAPSEMPKKLLQKNKLFLGGLLSRAADQRFREAPSERRSERL